MKVVRLLVFLICLSAPVMASAVLSEGAMLAVLKSQLESLKSQYAMLQRQYALLQQQLGAMRNGNKRGEQEWKAAVKATNAVPGTWQDVVARQKSGDLETYREFASRRKKNEQKLQALPSAEFSSPGKQRAKDYQLSADSVLAAMSGGEALYDEVSVHLNNLVKIGRDIDKTDNVKEAQDMQNRLSVEAAMLQAAMTRMNALHMQLQAASVNQENRAEAANEMFYQWKGKDNDR